MDPQHRLLLEVAWSALEQAGALPDRGQSRRAGVFVGIGSTDYLQRVAGQRSADEIDAWTGTGNATAFSAGRLAFHLGLDGPAMAVDTACSSSLVATHLAAQSLRAGECDLAVAAGVSLIIDPTVSVYLTRARALAPDGRCKTFDVAANGYGRGEGCGVVVLKRLSDALAAGDHIHAVIRGTAVNHDGRSSGITVPNGTAQQTVIRRALAQSGLPPEAVGYVEAHGTGTGLGDPIEVGALDAVLGRSHDLTVGTLKTNLGHLEAAAGIAGLMKAALVVEHAELVPNLHFHTRNPHIDPAIPLVVPTRRAPWPLPGTPVAGVSAFGLSGTNAHVVLTGPPADTRPAPPDQSAYLLPITAASPAALIALAARLADHLDTHPTLHPLDVAWSLATGRGRLSCAAAVVGADLAAWVRALRSLEEASISAVRAAPGVLLVVDAGGVAGSPSLDPDLAEAPGDVAQRAGLMMLRRLNRLGVSPATVVGSGLLARVAAGELSEADALVALGNPQVTLLGGAPAIPRVGTIEEAPSGLLPVHLAVWGDRDAWLNTLAALHRAGVTLDWRAELASGRRVLVPGTVFQRRRCWLDIVEAPVKGRLATAPFTGVLPDNQPRPTPSGPDPRPQAERNNPKPDPTRGLDPRPSQAPVGPTQGQPFLGARVRLPLLPHVVFASTLSAASPAWLGHHRLFGRVVTPGAAHIALALAAARSARGLSTCTLADISFSRALILEEGEVREVQILISGTSDTGVPAGQAPSGQALQIGSVRDGEVLVHSAGRVLDTPLTLGKAAEPLSAVQARLSAEGGSSSFYERFDRAGYTLGSAFRWMGETWRRDGEALCRMDVPAELDGADHAPLHPGLIDSCFQLLTRCLPAERVAEVLDGSALFVPVAVERFTWVAGAPGATPTLFAHAVLREPQVADVQLRDADGMIYARIDGLRVARVPRTVLGGGRAAPDDVYELRWRNSAVEEEDPGAAPSRWVVLVDGGGTGEALVATLQRAGRRVLAARRGAGFRLESPGNYVLDPAVPSAWTRLLAAATGPGRLRVVSCWGLDAAAEAPSPERVIEALHLVRALQKERLYLLTRGAVGAEGAGLGRAGGRDPESAARLDQNALLGLQRTVAMEKPGLDCTSIDLDPALPADAVADLVEELERASAADQVRLRLAGRAVARLAERRAVAPLGSVRFAVGDPGALESVTARPAPRTPPGPGEVEIEVRATGLNFRDVLGALGAYPGDPGPLGGEATGVVRAVGAGVQTVAPGDRVVTMLASSGCYRSFATSDARFVARLPDSLGFVEGATVPVAYATVLLGLETFAGLRRGETVLIHAASGGVGLAAVQYALSVGAEVIGTAGSVSKRRALSELGVRHVFSSRDLGYAAAIRSLTGGRGVDVVLNSLGVEHVAESLSVLADGGRFCEIGKADVLDAARVAALGRGIRYHHFDLVTLSQTDPSRIQALLVDIMARLAAAQLRPLPSRSFGVDETVAAFRHMARARHVGKVVVTWPEPARSAPIRADRAYLVTGGLGSLGRRLGAWLVGEGAGLVVLLSRSAPSAATQAELAALGRAVRVVAADVADPSALNAVIAGLPMPLGGVFHAAGVLDDALLPEQDEARVRRVMRPKQNGAWNLHLAGGALDHFVLFSSVSGVLGSPGQASYSAANAWLDGLAALRQRHGLPALSIAWGPWAEGGMAEVAAAKGRWSRVGITPILPDRGLEILGALLGDTAHNVAVLPMDRARMVRGLSLGPVPPLMLELLEAEQGGDPREETRRAALADLHASDDPEERVELLIDYLCCCLGSVTEQDEVDPHAPLTDNDSLVAVEFTALLESELGVTLKTDALFKAKDLTDLAELLVDKLPGR